MKTIQLPDSDTTQMAVEVITNLQAKKSKQVANQVEVETVLNTMKSIDNVQDMVSNKANLIVLQTPLTSTKAAIGDINMSVKAQNAAASYNGLVNDGILTTIVTLGTNDPELAAKQNEIADLSQQGNAHVSILEHARIAKNKTADGQNLLHIAIDNKTLTHPNVFDAPIGPAKVAMLISNMMGNVEKCDRTLAKQLVV